MAPLGEINLSTGPDFGRLIAYLIINAFIITGGGFMQASRLWLAAAVGERRRAEVQLERSQLLVDRPRRRAARERDPERRPAAGAVRDPAGGQLRQVPAYEKLRTASS